MKIYFLKTKKGLIPENETDYSKYQKLNIGTVYEFDVKHPRNYEFHKKFFALISLAFENQDKFINEDHYRKYLICKAGFYTAVETDTGTFVIADSISFGSMDNLKFEELYGKMMTVVIKEIGVTSEQIRQEIVNFL